MIPEAHPCKHCKRQPTVVSVPGDVFYAQCVCGKWNPYEFIGVNPAGAIENWNIYNPKPKRTNHDGNKQPDCH